MGRILVNCLFKDRMAANFTLKLIINIFEKLYSKIYSFTCVTNFVANRHLFDEQSDIRTKLRCQFAIKSVKTILLSTFKILRSCYYEKKLADNMNQKLFNAYLKSKTKTKPLIGPLKTDNNTVSDNTEMSTIFNNYFCSVFSIENTTNMQRAVTLDFMSPIRNVIFSRSR